MLSRLHFEYLSRRDIILYAFLPYMGENGRNKQTLPLCAVYASAQWSAAGRGRRHRRCERKGQFVAFTVRRINNAPCNAILKALPPSSPFPSHPTAPPSPEVRHALHVLTLIQRNLTY